MLKRASVCYLSALLVMLTGILLSAHYYPGGFDWAYTVASALMSQKHNPLGSVWFGVGMSGSTFILWFYVSCIRQAMPDAERFIRLLRLGLVCGMLVGLERLLFYDLSRLIHKAHELIAFLTFAGLYFGVIGVMVRMWKQERQWRLSVLAAAIPLTIVSIQLFYLYLTQRHLGWVNVSWREKGIPIWVSFAFWQWWMIGSLWLGLGVLMRGIKRES